MPCFDPIRARYTDEPNENGKRQVIFKWKGSLNEYDLILPCGKCLGCAQAKRIKWGVRMYHESLMHERNCMVTLTYDDENLPMPPRISKPEVQKFIKRLRKQIPGIRYFATGEYGDQTRRPHYHICIFGEDFRAISRSLGNGMYTNHQLGSLWGKGHTSAISLDPGAAFYTAGYVTKKIGDTDNFNLMSRRPPIGKQWLLDNKHRLGNLEFFTIGGQPYPIPNEYFEWAPEEFDHIQGNQWSKDLDFRTIQARAKNARALLTLKKQESI